MANEALNIGDLIDGRYQLEKKIGDGGSATVYLADDTLIGREVAIKILRDDDENDTNTRSFLTEAQAVTVLSHPNIVGVYDVAVKPDLKYIVMEFVDGITLRRYMDHNGAAEPEEVVNCAGQVLNALDAAHAHGIIHRDIKPQNILLLRDGTIKVTDFGIAMLPSGDELSMEGRAIGTVYYISPEQAKGQAVDERSDIYSLGVLMYEMATGELPFTGKDPSDVAMKQITDTPRPPREINPRIPVGLEQIILAAMEKDPDDRFQSAAAMLHAIEKLDSDPNHIFRNLGAVRKGRPAGARKEHPKLRVILPIVAGVVAVGVALAVLFATGVIRPTEKPVEATEETIIVDIPQFVGRVYLPELHDDYLLNQHININVVYVYTSKAAAGVVLNQSVEAGSSQKIKKSGRVDVVLYVSLGQRPIELGTVEGDYRDVISELQRLYGDLNFKVIRLWEYSESVPENHVVRWESTTSADVIVGSIITLHISAGPSSERYTTSVPNVLGKTISEAVLEIEAAGLHVGNIEYRISKTIEENRVMEQERRPGDQIEAKVNTISLVVGGGLDYGN